MTDCGLTLITGASAGIGAAFAREFAAHGHSLVLVARSKAPLEALAGELATKHGVDCSAVAADISVESGLGGLLGELEARRLDVDVLVNNAGVLNEGRLWETELAREQQLVRLNVLAPLTLTHELLHGMIRRGRGRILNVASASAFYPIPRLATYAASKAFLLWMTEALSVELRGTGVTATTLCPGFTDTTMIHRHDGNGSMRLPFVPNASAEDVAREGYEACMKGTPVKVVGLLNQVVAGLVGRQPRFVQRAATGLLGSVVLGRSRGGAG
jgi:short-subunit dehydrogenase